MIDEETLNELSKEALALRIKHLKAENTLARHILVRGAVKYSLDLDFANLFMRLAQEQDVYLCGAHHWFLGKKLGTAAALSPDEVEILESLVEIGLVEKKEVK